jgi:hypothetical protein
VVAVSLFLVTSAHASMIQLFIDPGFGSTENTGSTATLTLDFSEQGTDDYLTVIIQNTTPPEIGSKLTAAGLELPDLQSLPATFAPGGTSSYFDVLSMDYSILPGWLDAPGGYDVVISSDGNFLGGNPNGAPMAGESQTIVLNLGDTGLAQTDLVAAFEDLYAGSDDRYAIGRFQAVGPDEEDSDEVGGRVPEPATIVLLALGGLALRRRS